MGKGFNMQIYQRKSISKIESQKNVFDEDKESEENENRFEIEQNTWIILIFTFIYLSFTLYLITNDIISY